MTARDKTTIKSYFETGDKPTAAQFVDFIDSYQDAGNYVSALTGDMTITTPVSGSAVATIASAAVTGAKIANATIQGANIASGAIGAVNVNASAKSGSASIFATVSGAVTAGHAAIFDANGNVIDGGAASTVLTLIKSVTVASPVASVSFINGTAGVILDGTYSNYILIFYGVTMATGGGDSLDLVTSSNGGSTWNSSYNTAGAANSASGTTTVTGQGATSASAWGLTASSGNAAGSSLSGQVMLHNMPSSSLATSMRCHSVAAETGNATIKILSGSRSAAATDNAFKISGDNGNISSGVFELYGVL